MCPLVGFSVYGGGRWKVTPDSAGQRFESGGILKKECLKRDFRRCILFRALRKTWWLLAVAGIADAMSAAMNLLMMNPDRSLSLREFALANQVWDMSMLALLAGACAVVAGLWNSGKDYSWLLSLHGVALAAFG